MGNSHLQDSMFGEIDNKEVFEKAKTYGYEFLDHVFDRNVYPTDKALENLIHFEEPMPSEGFDAGAVIDMLHQYGAPATVTHMGGRYFGFVCGSTVPAALAAKQLATFWDQCTPMYVLSPVSAKLETVVETWLKDIFNLPAQTVAGFVSGTSVANFCGLAAARYRILKRQNWDINDKGLFGAPAIRIVAGNQAHATIVKAISLLGLGKDNIEWVDTDTEGRIIADKVPVLDDKTILILQAGNVNTGSFDPFPELCDKANKANAWVHIDGAFGLWAAASEQLKSFTKGIEKANSWAVDGHKTLNTPYDCGIVLCNDKEALTAALHATGSYLVVNDAERNGMLYTPEMSRRSRIIELWATMKYLGKSGISQMINTMCERAVQFANEISSIKGFKVLNEIAFNQVLISCETDELTAKTLERVQKLRTCWAGGSVWNGKKVIRISVCSWATTSDDIIQSVKSFEQALTDISAQ
jgi:glutamate/tyrosine decarboxylase-like PLP-dependent enzyme